MKPFLDGIKQVSVSYENFSVVFRGVKKIILNFDSVNRRWIISKEIVMVTGRVKNLGTGLNTVENFINQPVVVFQPIPLFCQPPPVKKVANQEQFFGLVLL